MSGSGPKITVDDDRVTSFVGDIRFHAVNSPYEGYHRMNGAAAGTLPAASQAGLASLGLAAVPNIANRKIRSGGVPGTIGGSNTVTLTRANMPSGAVTGTTPTGGAHSHGLNNNTLVRNGGNVNPKTTNGGGITAQTAVMSINNSNQVHTHTISASTGGSNTAVNLNRRIISVKFFMCLDNTVLNVWAPIEGDIKHSFQLADHGGWILMNGRLKTLLTANQQAMATALGIGANIPNATGLTLKTKGALYTIGGSDTTVLTPANIAGTFAVNSNTLTATHDHSINNAQHRSGANGAQISHKKNAPNTFPMLTYNIGSGGAHSHPYTLNLGGSNTPIAVLLPYITANSFIYLGV